MVGKAFAAILVSLLAASCARDSAVRGPESPQAQAGSALITALRVGANPAEMPEGERLAMEAHALQIIAAGADAVAPMLSDIESRRDPGRRAVLVRLLAISLNRMPNDSPPREAADKLVADASARLLGSADASDRRVGAHLSSLPQRSMLVLSAVRLLEDADARNRAFGIFVLRQVAQADMGFDPDGGEEARKAAVARWKTWWSRNRSNSLYYSQTGLANPVSQAYLAEAAEIARFAGPYPVEVTDASTGLPVAGAILAYEYAFTTFDGRGNRMREHAAADSQGKLLLAAHSVPAGTRFVGATLIVSKAGYRQQNIAVLPHLLTPNSFTITIELEPQRE